MDKEKVRKQAKQILDKFAKALEKVEDEKDIDFYVDREKSEREEGGGRECKDFKKKLLENAPEKNNDFVIVEKGDWK